MQIPKSISKLIEKLNTDGYEAFLVGGCVRDFILNQVPKDYDVATNATPEQVKEVFHGIPVIETGIAHGTVTVLWGENPIEITTYRIDGDYQDFRRPNEVQFTKQLKDDLARRDFTMNALAYHPEIGLIDYFNGVQDIENKIIRCVGIAEERFSEDALRIMRALRFASQLAFSIEAETSIALFTKKELLKHISVERIRVELEKLLCGAGVKEILFDYKEILATIIPELKSLFDFNQQNPHHLYPLYDHIVFSVAAIEAEPILRLTMFFHDIGKPTTFHIDEKGIGHFYNHGEVSSAMTRVILRRLKFDNKTIYKADKLVKYHDYPLEPKRKSIRKAVLLVTDLFDELLQVKEADYKAQAFSEEKIARLEEIKLIWKQMQIEKECLSLKDLVISGRELDKMEPAYRGRILSSLLEEVMEEKIENEKNSLLVRATELYQQFLFEDSTSD